MPLGWNSRRPSLSRYLSTRPDWLTVVSKLDLSKLLTRAVPLELLNFDASLTGRDSSDVWNQGRKRHLLAQQDVRELVRLKGQIVSTFQVLIL